MRRALIVGIDDYPNNPLHGCAADAKAMSELLERHHNGDANFQCITLTSSPASVTRSALRAALERLFAQYADLVLFYFSGHGININQLGGYLVTQDATSYEPGVSMQDLLSMANNSSVKEVVIILDCCDSGAFGSVPAVADNRIFLRQGVCALTASGPQESAVEASGRGIFTRLVCDALAGGAADIRGEVNAASVYSYCDQILGAWDQRPRFMANVASLTELRMAQPQVELSVLRKIAEYFPSPDYLYPLDPSYEPDKRNLPPETAIDKEHETVFGNLQKFRAARLVEPVGEEHMYFAAVNSKGCQLTPLGQFYWQMIVSKKI